MIFNIQVPEPNAVESNLSLLASQIGFDISAKTTLETSTSSSMTTSTETKKEATEKSKFFTADLSR